jgi:hypothetical protein
MVGRCIGRFRLLVFEKADSLHIQRPTRARFPYSHDRIRWNGGVMGRQVSILTWKILMNEKKLHS